MNEDHILKSHKWQNHQRYRRYWPKIAEKELESTTSTSAAEPTKEHKKTIYGLKYVYDYINRDDEIDVVKRKIEINAKIPMEAQHNWYTFMKNNRKYVKLFDYQCRTVINESVSQLFPVSIDSMFAKSKKGKRILGLPTDSDFIRKYKQKSQLHILNLTNNILSDKYYAYFDQKYTINVLSLYDILNQIGIGKIQSLRSDSYNKYESFYYGIVLKYWPMVKLPDLSSILSRGQFPGISANAKMYDKMFSDRQYYINLANSIDSKEICQVVDLNSGITGFDFTHRDWNDDSIYPERL